MNIGQPADKVGHMLDNMRSDRIGHATIADDLTEGLVGPHDEIDLGDVRYRDILMFLVFPTQGLAIEVIDVHHLAAGTRHHRAI
ncbi:MAG TPA: hypothetical protein DDZ67_00815 [Xanthomonadaceae bacterium]|nr:hypothetical protein [Xanthomonadaceae bacterium]